tara:strand:- start:1987 stop:3309 length:1323 start_codon:yes stop_codon:yes gene_type:complete
MSKVISSNKVANRSRGKQDISLGLSTDVHPKTAVLDGNNSALDSYNFALDPNSKEGLQATFELFNRMSDDLADSYRALEARVGALTAELDRVNAQKAQEVQSKDRVSARLSNLLDLLPGGVIVLDRWGTISQINPAGEELLARDLTGRKWVDIIAEFFAPKNDDGHEISMKSGKRVSLSTRSLEQETGQIILLTDQTETRHLQAQLSRGQRLSALGRMVSALAHQIRTPLSAAILYASHLKERDLTVEQTQRFSEKISSRLHHLEQQVSDMLVFAKGDVVLNDHCSVATLISELQSAVDVSLQANEAQLFVSNRCPELMLNCNLQSLIGALSNLINNALQASLLASDVELACQIKDQQFTMTVTDHGAGIAPQLLQRLMDEEAFVSTKSQGTGLGLAVVRAVAKAHHGQFQLSSIEQQGTSASICIPVNEVTRSAGNWHE